MLINYLRNINLILINYCFHINFRGRLNLISLSLLRKPVIFGNNVSTLFIVTHVGILNCDFFTTSLEAALLITQRSTTTNKLICSFSIQLQSRLFSIGKINMVSYYAFIIGQLLPSSPPIFLNLFHHLLYTLLKFKDFSLQSGLFPSRTQILSPTFRLLYLLQQYFKIQ